MYTCDDCKDLLFDSLYGLLDEAQERALREHLAACPACQADLTAAESQQGLLARAAQVYSELPLFTAPGAPAETAVTPAPAALIETRTTAVADTPAEGITSLPQPAPAPEPAVLPMPAPARRPARRWRWVVAAAASLLLIASGAYALHLHREGLTERQDALARLKKEVQKVEASFASFQRDHARQKADLPATVQAGYLQLQVASPASYQRSSPSQIRILTHDLSGKAAPAEVALRLLDDTTQPPRILFEKKTDSTGEALVTLPAGLDVRADSLARLEVKARRGDAAQKIEELLTVAGPSRTAHLAANKGTYRPGEVLFFRALVLDRFSLRTPESELAVVFTLNDRNNRPVRRLEAVTKDGVASGEFALTTDLSDGSYTLHAADPASGNTAPRFLAESRRLTLLREEAPLLVFDRRQYAPGETGNAAFRGRLNYQGAAVPNQPVTVSAEVNGKLVPLMGAKGGRPLQLRTDRSGKAAFQFQVPPGLPAAANMLMKVQVHDGVNDEQLALPVPLTPPQPFGAVAPPGARDDKDTPPVPLPAPESSSTDAPSVEFFPEGGDLVAGVVNRLYFRARDARGQPVAVQGIVRDRQGKEVAQAQTQAQGWQPAGLIGVFTLTPAAGEAYRLEVSSFVGQAFQPDGTSRQAGKPDLQKNTSVVVPLPAVRSGGVTLTLPAAVGKEGEPLRLVVRDARPGRSLMVLASCRGRVVDQKLVSADARGTEVELTPVAGTRGVVRLTVCEVQQGQLVPLAERLAYRAPAEFLVLALTEGSAQGKSGYRPGERVRLNIEARTEQGKLAPAWIMGAVIDEKMRRTASGETPISPPTHFYLTREVGHPQELEDADFLLADLPAARAALDQYLATQGWRRFVPVEGAEAPTQLTANEARNKAREGQPAVLLSATRPDALRALYAEELAKSAKRLHQQGENEHAKLKGEKDRLTEEARLAALDLAHFEQVPLAYLRQAVVAVLVVSFAVGCLLLALGLVRLLRNSGSPRASLVLASVALGLCLGSLFVASSLAPPEEGRAQGLLAWLPGRPWPAFDPDPASRSGQPGQTDGARVAAPPRAHLLAVLEEKQALRASPPARSARGGEEAKTSADRTAQGYAYYHQPAHADLSSYLTDQVQGEPSVMARRFGALESRQQLLSPGAGVPSPAPQSQPQPPAVPGGQPSAGLGGFAPVDPGKGDKKGEKAVFAKGGKGKAAEREAPVVEREFAHRQPRGGVEFQETLYWHPALEAPAGQASIEFDLSSRITTYHILLYGHTPSGRLGVYEGKLEPRK
ncbi:MAG: zf-HC2 domain-containing protein [Gemmataceae bacterium]|nr:zf-HC2 domain-containing protein [Gemmataceae bacterium]